MTFACQMTARGTPEAPASVPMQWTGIFDLDTKDFSLGPIIGLGITVENPDWIIAQQSLDLGKGGVMAGFVSLERASGKIEYASFGSYCVRDDCKETRYETRLWSGICSPGF
ncbi:hypothetical protein [uncultured Roseovarius sp.]|uniref:hypothetical protein n=1 Tax=uncultured Roseovarius sp. TaxID=293344 RepID=UPI002630B77F|nr:hypothetical protein [uncultured Roseovarius sp.]